MGEILRDIGDVRRAPLTYAILAVLLVTTIAQHVASPATAHGWLMGASTDVTNLRHRPLYVLLTSAAWLPRGVWPPYVLVFALVLAPVERAIGTGRALLVYVSGHVGATVLTEVPVAVAAAARWLPPSSETRLDVGISYVVFVSAAVYAGMLRGRGRAVVGALVLAALAVPMVVDFDLSGCGHVAAALIGLLWWPWLRRCSRLGTFASIRDAVLGRATVGRAEPVGEPVSC